MSKDPHKVGTLEGDGHLVLGDQQVEAHYYLEVFEEAGKGASSTRRYSGMIAAPGEALLDVGSQYGLALDDGSLLHFKVTGRHFSVMGPKQYGIVGLGSLVPPGR